LAINYQDKIFGKNLLMMLVKTSTHRIPEKPKVNPTVKRFLQTSKKDSLKISK
jgi:hypothetical protein